MKDMNFLSRPVFLADQSGTISARISELQGFDW
jgi:hypothetical protein